MKPLLALLAVVALTTSGRAQFVLAARPAAPAEIDFNRDVRPILSDKCFACHGPDEKHRKAKLRLDVEEVALDRGAVVPGKPAESALVGRITAANEDERMPPAK